MKNIALFLGLIILVSSCASSKKTAGTEMTKREIRKATEIALVKKAVESRRYIIKVDRMYSERGFIADLRPANNFIIINGELATVSLPYIGSSLGARPISGINFNGQTFRYEMKSTEGKGVYEINMKVGKGNDSFNIYLNVGDEGYCTFSMNNPYISTVSYKGKLVPIPSKIELEENPGAIRM